MTLVDPFILVDGSQYLFRAFNAMPEMRTSRGFPTNAIHGVVGMLRKLVRLHPGSTVVVVFDAPGKTFRDDIYPAYKAHRPPMADDLKVQIDPIHAFVDAMGLPRLMLAGVEADDVIGTLASQATAAQRDTLISSSDKDLAQLVSEHVHLQDSMGDTTMSPAGVLDRFGVNPNQIIDYLALMGDKIDNIPGIPGVGKKTAAKWLQEHGDLATVIATADHVKGKIGEKLRANIDQLPLSRELATIKCDVAMDYHLGNLTKRPPDTARLFELCQTYELRTLGSQFADDMGNLVSGKVVAKDSNPSETTFEPVKTTQALNDLIERVKGSSNCALYIVATRHHAFDHTVHGIGLSTDGSHVSFIPCASNIEQESLAVDTVLSKMQTVLEDESLVLLTHNAKAIRHILASFSIQLRADIHDVMLMSYVLNSTGHGDHRLRGITGAVSARTIMDERDLLGTGAKRIGYDAAKTEALYRFVNDQVSSIYQLYETMSARLQTHEKLQTIYEAVELKLEPFLWEMEHRGTLVDLNVLDTLHAELEQRKVELVASAHELAGHEFNLGSPKQLEVVLYDEIALPAPPTSKSGSRSTKEDLLRGLTQYHPLPQVILNYRATTKLISTYIVGLTREINPETQRIHTTFSQANASTGRLASIDPNLQNIPIRTAEGRRVREAFIAPSGHVLLTADYSQIELRVMAHITNDPGLVEAFTNGSDIHCATAAEVFDVPLHEVSADQRRSAKAINFGLMYGMSAFGLARTLEIPQRQARSYISAYFTRYPAVQDYVKTIKEQAKAHGYVETIYGRRIHLRDIAARNPILRQAAERLAINAPVQGSAADIIKKATIQVGEWLHESHLNIHMILQVHDELVFEVGNEDLEEAQTQIPNLMRSAVDLSVPLEVDIGVALNWSAAH